MPPDHLPTMLTPIELPAIVNKNASAATNIPGVLLHILVTSLAVVGMNIVGFVIGVIGCMGWAAMSEDNSGEGTSLFLLVSKNIWFGCCLGIWKWRS